MSKHIKLSHIEVKFNCDKCGMMFENNNRLGEHMKTHHLDMNRRLECDECSIAFGEKSKLNKHEN